jgi:elongation factor G
MQCLQDFSIEVERSVRVLDGAVVVFDAVAGVQAQTETVWRTTHKHGIPALAFINKMDRQGAEMQRAIDSMRSRLGVTPVAVQLPIGSEHSYCGAVDLISMEALVYGEHIDADTVDTSFTINSSSSAAARDSTRIHRLQLSAVEAVYTGITAEAVSARHNMLQSLAEADEEFMEIYLDSGKLILICHYHDDNVNIYLSLKRSRHSDVSTS